MKLEILTNVELMDAYGNAFADAVEQSTSYDDLEAKQLQAVAQAQLAADQEAHDEEVARLEAVQTNEIIELEEEHKAVLDKAVVERDAAIKAVGEWSRKAGLLEGEIESRIEQAVQKERQAIADEWGKLFVSDMNEMNIVRAFNRIALRLQKGESIEEKPDEERK